MKCRSLLLLLLPALAHADEVVVPNDKAGKEAAVGNRFPFGPFPDQPPLHYQQAYAEGELTHLVGRSITALAFRLDNSQASQPGGNVYTDFELRLSSAPGLVDQLDADLSGNPGADETVVFAGTYVLPALQGGSTPNSFDLTIPLQTPFPYSGGDLLVDVRYTATDAPPFACDSLADIPDAVSRAWTEAGGSGQDSRGLVTRFAADCPSVSAVRYCDPSVPNSTGLSATIEACGSPFALSGFLVLRAKDMPVGQFGYFLVGELQGLVMPPGSDGNLCLGGAIGRYSKPAQVQVAIDGTFQLEIDTGKLPFNPARPVMAGDTYRFSAWYRDAAVGSSNFTDGVEVTWL